MGKKVISNVVPGNLESWFKKTQTLLIFSSQVFFKTEEQTDRLIYLLWIFQCETSGICTVGFQDAKNPEHPRRKWIGSEILFVSKMWQQPSSVHNSKQHPFLGGSTTQGFWHQYPSWLVLIWVNLRCRRYTCAHTLAREKSQDVVTGSSTWNPAGFWCFWKCNGEMELQ